MQFRPVVSAIFFKLRSKTCGYLLIIRHIPNKISTVRGKAVLYLPACYFVINCTLPLYEFYTVYEIAV